MLLSDTGKRAVLVVDAVIARSGPSHIDSHDGNDIGSGSRERERAFARREHDSTFRDVNIHGDAREQQHRQPGCMCARRCVPRGPRACCCCCCCCVVSHRVPLSSSRSGSRGRPPSRRLGGTTTITMASHGQPRDDDDDDDDDCGNRTVTISRSPSVFSRSTSTASEPSREDPPRSRPTTPRCCETALSHSRFAVCSLLRSVLVSRSFSSFLTHLLSFSPRLGTPRIHLSRGFV